MTTDAQRRASHKLSEGRKAAGLKAVTVWLSEAARLKLAQDRARYGSKDKAAEAAILAHRPPDA